MKTCNFSMHDCVSNNKNPCKDKRVWSPFVTMAACYSWHAGLAEPPCSGGRRALSTVRLTEAGLLRWRSHEMRRCQCVRRAELMQWYSVHIFWFSRPRYTFWTNPESLVIENSSRELTWAEHDGVLHIDNLI